MNEKLQMLPHLQHLGLANLGSASAKRATARSTRPKGIGHSSGRGISLLEAPGDPRGWKTWARPEREAVQRSRDQARVLLVQCPNKKLRSRV